MFSAWRDIDLAGLLRKGLHSSRLSGTHKNQLFAITKLKGTLIFSWKHVQVLAFLRNALSMYLMQFNQLKTLIRLLPRLALWLCSPIDDNYFFVYFFHIPEKFKSANDCFSFLCTNHLRPMREKFHLNDPTFYGWESNLCPLKVPCTPNERFIHLNTVFKLKT